MKLQVDFTTDKPEFPLEYRKTFLHLFKSILTSENEGKSYDQYYGGNIRKDFTFAVFFDKPQFTKEKITMRTSRVKLIFSTSDQMTGYIFLAGLIARKNKKIPLADDNYLVLKNVKRLKEHKVEQNKVIVKMNSPLVIREHTKEGNKDYYYSVAHADFIGHAESIVKKQLKMAGFTEDYTDTLKIKPLNCKTAVVKFYGCYIETTVGTLLLEGEVDVLNYLVMSGVGGRKNSGFGCVEVLTEQL